MSSPADVTAPQRAHDALVSHLRPTVMAMDWQAGIACARLFFRAACDDALSQCNQFRAASVRDCADRGDALLTAMQVRIGQRLGVATPWASVAVDPDMVIPELRGMADKCDGDVAWVLACALEIAVSAVEASGVPVAAMGQRFLAISETYLPIVEMVGGPNRKASA